MSSFIIPASKYSTLSEFDDMQNITVLNQSDILIASCLATSSFIRSPHSSALSGSSPQVSYICIVSASLYS